MIPSSRSSYFFSSEFTASVSSVLSSVEAVVVSSTDDVLSVVSDDEEFSDLSQPAKHETSPIARINAIIFFVFIKKPPINN